MHTQCLTLTLDGITAADYLAWVRDPEPPLLGGELRSVALRADPRGDTIDASLTWEHAPPPVHDSAPAAGLPLTPEVAGVEVCELALAA
jgi:hypothetical protein